MNNNRGSNRRRGRGSNRQQGGQQVNRIDSRARGNAPQLLEKYRKLAHDAHLNGDRVQEEYYLQFADHYFRVMSDQRQRQEEARQRRDDRSQDQDESGRGDESGASASDSRNAGNGRDHDDRVEELEAERSAQDEVGSEYEQPDNPFIRESRGSRGRKPRRKQRGDDEERGDNDAGESESATGLDPSALPPAISGSGEDKAPDAETAAEAKPRRRTRRTPPPADDSGESLEAVN